MLEAMRHSPKRHKYFLEPKHDTLNIRSKQLRMEKSVEEKRALRSNAKKLSRIVNVSDFASLKNKAEIKVWLNNVLTSYQSHFSEVALFHADHIVVLSGHVFLHVVHVDLLLAGAPLGVLGGGCFGEPLVELNSEAVLVVLVQRNEGGSFRIDVHF